jgi:hypothetical protein
MATGATSGNGALTLEDEWTGEVLGEDELLEDEDEYGFAQPESAWAHEDELAGEAWEGAFEDETAAFENEWSPETMYAGSPESAFETGYELQEDEAWESSAFESGFELAHEGAFEDESDQFLPFLAPLAMKALPMLAKAALPTIRRLLPVARNAVQNVVRNVTSTPIPPSIAPTARVLMRGLQQPSPYRRPPVRRPWTPPRPNFGPLPSPTPGRPPFPLPFPMPPVSPPRPVPQSPMTVGTILRRLSDILQVGDAVAQEAEAAFFGSNEYQTELGSNELAHEAALTEVLAAEAAHAGTDREAGALLGSALPITIRVMAGGREVRPLVPTLQRANARLVTSLRRSGPGGPQLLRAVPTIQRRTIATIREARRNGRPVGHRMVGPIMAAHAARVLGTPHTCGRVLLRNTTIRQGTVAPTVRRVRPGNR